MIRLVLRSITDHKVRLAMTALSIALGVAFVAGTFVFTDSIQARFDTLFDDVYAGVDATVRPTSDATSDVLAEDLVMALNELDGVDAAVGSVGGFAQPIDSDGTPIGGQGPPNLGMSWIDVEALNALQIADGNGRAPTSAGEIVIDAGTAEANGFVVGDDINVAFIGQPVETFELVGIATFGSADSLAGATLSAFSLEEAQRLFAVEGFHQIDVLATGDVGDEILIETIAAIIPTDTEVVSGDDQTQEQLAEVTEGLGFITTGLLAFAGVAVFVGAFIIQNTFRITVAQRTKELALLRAIGASAKQVTRIVALEALTISIIASALGVGLGVGLAEALKLILDAAGFGIPNGPLTITWQAVGISMTVGIIVTVASSLLPARKAAQISPIEAMRAGDVRTTPRSLRRRAIAGVTVSAAGASLMALGLSEAVGNGIAWVGAGALGVFLGISVLAPLMARPIATVVGWPLPRLFGVPGQLATDNARRQPRRTAATASALMVGVALVGFVAVFATSIKASTASTLEGAFPADYSIQSTNVQSPVGTEFVVRASDLPEVATASGVQATQVTISDQAEQVVGVDPTTISAVYDMGAAQPLAALDDGLFVREDTLEEDGYAVGDIVEVGFADGPTQLEVTGTFTDTSFAAFMVSTETLSANGESVDSFIVFTRLVESADLDEARSAIESLAADYGNLQVQTLSEFIDGVEAQVDQLLGLFQGLLGLAIVIAVLGITNTLALSVVERTSEVGLLRAIGMSRRQVRRMIRWEAVIISIFGAILGVAVGIGMGWAVVTALAEDGLGEFVVPSANLAIYVLLAGLAGIVAAIGPARSASRLKILDAIAYE